MKELIKQNSLMYHNLMVQVGLQSLSNLLLAMEYTVDFGGPLGLMKMCCYFLDLSIHLKITFLDYDFLKYHKFQI